MTPPAATSEPVTLGDIRDELRALRAEVAAQRPAWGNWLDLPTASLYCGLSVKSLRRAISAGRITAHRLVRGKVLINRLELDATIRRC